MLFHDSIVTKFVSNLCHPVDYCFGTMASLLNRPVVNSQNFGKDWYSCNFPAPFYFSENLHKVIRPRRAINHRTALDNKLGYTVNANIVQGSKSHFYFVPPLIAIQKPQNFILSHRGRQIKIFFPLI